MEKKRNTGFLISDDKLESAILYVRSLAITNIQTFPSTSVDSDKLPCLCCLLVGSEWLRRSFPPGLDDALPYQIIPTTAMIMPMTTWRLRPSFPKKRKPMIKTRIVFIWPITWKETAVNLPMQMNWLRLVPTAMVQDRIINICKIQQEKQELSNCSS